MLKFLLCVSLGLLAQVSVFGAPAAAGGAGAIRRAGDRPLAITFSGRVLTDKGLPLPGVVVAVKKNSLVTTTNSAGAFLLAVDSATPTLLFTHPGYQSQTMVAQSTGTLNVTMYLIGVAPPMAAAPAPTTISATPEPDASNGTVYTEDMPTFPGGDAAYVAYLRQNAHYPERALQKGVSGVVFVHFVVDELGRILDAEVIKGCGDGLDEEALRLVRLMPWWVPGRAGGKAVRVAQTLRIKFGMQERP